MATTKSQVGLWLVPGWRLLEIQVTTSGHGPLQDCRLYKRYYFSGETSTSPTSNTIWIETMMERYNEILKYKHL